MITPKFFTIDKDSMKGLEIPDANKMLMEASNRALDGIRIKMKEQFDTLAPDFHESRADEVRRIREILVTGRIGPNDVDIGPWDCRSDYAITPSLKPEFATAWVRLLSGLLEPRETP